MKFLQRFLELTGVKRIGPDDLDGFPDGYYKVKKSCYPYGHTGVLAIKNNEAIFFHLSKNGGFQHDYARQYMQNPETKCKFRIHSIATDDLAAGQRLKKVTSELSWDLNPNKPRWGEHPEYTFCENVANEIVEGIPYSETVEKIRLYRAILNLGR